MGVVETRILQSPKKMRLLEILSEHSFMTIREALEIYRNRSMGYLTLKSLANGGLIAPFSTHAIPARAYALTEAGWRFISEHGRLRAPRMWRAEDYLPQFFYHSLACLRTRLILEKEPKVSGWMPESLLHRGNGQRCVDAEFEYGKIHVGLEVELTLKSPARRKEILNLLDARTDLHRVLWVARGSPVSRAIREDILRENLPHAEKHFFVDADELWKTRLLSPGLLDVYGKVAQRG